VIGISCITGDVQPSWWALRRGRPEERFRSLVKTADAALVGFEDGIVARACGRAVVWLLREHSRRR
jgi:hypothetical protein